MEKWYNPRKSRERYRNLHLLLPRRQPTSNSAKGKSTEFTSHLSKGAWPWGDDRFLLSSALLCLWEGVLLFLKMPFCKMLSTL